MLTDTTTGGVWSSSTTTLATVSATGAVKSVASGTAAIVYSVSNSNGCKNSASASVTVTAPHAEPGSFTTSTSLVTAGHLNIAYTVLSVLVVTLKWSYSGPGATISATTNSLTFSYSTTATSGTISITASNSCGTSAVGTLAIIVFKSVLIPDSNLQG